MIFSTKRFRNVIAFFFLFFTAAAFSESNTAVADYDREEKFGGWVDENRDCLNTRHEVLKNRSLIPATIEKCKVTSGLWVDDYTGLILRNPKDIDVDHIVSLEDAWYSGAHSWDKRKRIRFANFLDVSYNFAITSASTNRAKGAKKPIEWLPPNQASWGNYLRTYIKIKQDWGLVIKDEEMELYHLLMNSTTDKSFTWLCIADDKNTNCKFIQKKDSTNVVSAG